MGKRTKRPVNLTLGEDALELLGDAPSRSAYVEAAVAQRSQDWRAALRRVAAHNGNVAALVDIVNQATCHTPLPELSSDTIGPDLNGTVMSWLPGLKSPTQELLIAASRLAVDVLVDRGLAIALVMLVREVRTGNLALARHLEARRQPAGGCRS